MNQNNTDSKKVYEAPSMEVIELTESPKVLMASIPENNRDFD